MGINLNSKNIGVINFDSRSIESIHYGGDLVWSGNLPSGTVLFNTKIGVSNSSPNEMVTLKLDKVKNNWSNLNKDMKFYFIRPNSNEESNINISLKELLAGFSGFEGNIPQLKATASETIPEITLYSPYKATTFITKIIVN